MWHYNIIYVGAALVHYCLSYVVAIILESNGRTKLLSANGTTSYSGQGTNIVEGLTYTPLFFVPCKLMCPPLATQSSRHVLHSFRLVYETLFIVNVVKKNGCFVSYIDAHNLDFQN